MGINLLQNLIIFTCIPQPIESENITAVYKKILIKFEKQL